MFKLNLKIAFRNLWKNKGFTLINVGGLAIGLASCMILLLYVTYEWGYDKQFKNYEKTYVVHNNQTTPTEIFSFNSTSGTLADEIRMKTPGVALVSKSSYVQNYLISDQQNSFKVECVFVEPDFLKIFDYSIVKGNQKTLLQNPNGVVINETLAKNLFGNEDPINKELKLNRGETVKVEAVMKDVPSNSSNQFSMIFTWKLYEKINPWTKDSGWNNNFCLTYVQLQNNSFFDQANQQLHGIVKSHVKDTNAELFLHPLSKWHLYDEFKNGKNVGGKIDQLKIFVLLALCILLVACVNFMNLSTAKSEKRAKEVGVRKAIGSTKKALVGQFMMESILISLFAMLVSFMLIEVALPYFNSIIHSQLQIQYSSWQFWLTFLGLALFTGLIAGSYPAFYLSSFSPIKVLKGFTVPAGSSLSIRKFLVVFQFSFAAFLIIFTTIIYQQINYIKNKPIGYAKANLIEIPLEGELLQPTKRQILKDQLIKSGAALAVTSYSAPLTRGGNNTYSISWAGKKKQDEVLINFRYADYDLLKTTGISLISGRDFDKAHADSANVMVNESFVKVMGIKNPLGAQITWFDDKKTIVGVIKNYIIESPYEVPKPMVIGFNQASVQTLIVKSNPKQNVSETVAAIQNALRAINPQFVPDLKFVDQNFERKFQNEKLLGTLANWFGGLAIFISCLGLLGLALYLAEQRKKEISIRKVLGANTLHILTLLNKDFIKLVMIANLIAFPIAYIAISKWLASYEFKIDISVFPFLLAIFLSMLIALLTVSIQSLKVARSNPIDTLKYE